LITDLGVFDCPPDGGMVCTELQEGITLADVRANTEARFDAALA
jgi:acyl CoA:acetate/3-ketoacid CoA transferase beta subunit